MKKRAALFIVTVMIMTLAGCGQENDPLENVVYEDNGSQAGGNTDNAADKPDETDTEAQAADATVQTSEEAAPEEVTEDTYEDNFAVDMEVAAAFGGKIKEAVAGKDIEKLADLTTFPVYVGLTEEGAVVETREDFIALGAEELFTDEMVKSIAGADEKNLSPSMAGFTLYDGEGAPSITFGVQDGRLGICGINY